MNPPLPTQATVARLFASFALFIPTRLGSTLPWLAFSSLPVSLFHRVGFFMEIPCGGRLRA